MIGQLPFAGDDRPLLGTWLKIPSVEPIELIGLAGFDFVVIDMEHSPITLETAAILTAVAVAHGPVPFVRVPDHTQSWIQRVLDSGAKGVLVPHVDSAAQATALMTAARHAPHGNRGVGPTSRAGAWGLRPMTHYLEDADRTAVIFQLETPEGIRDAEAIIDAGPTAVLIGPADLSVAMGVDAGHPEIVDAMRRTLELSHRKGIPCGIAVGSAERARELADDGFDFVMAGNDATMLGQAAQRMVSAFRQRTAPESTTNR